MSIGGDWKLLVYANTVEYAEHLVLVKGDLSGPEPVLVRMHGVNLLSDVLAAQGSATLHAAMRQIAAAGRGAVVLIRETRPTVLSDRVRHLSGAAQPTAPVARLWHRRADPARSGRQGYGPALQHAAHHHRHRGLRAEHCRPPAGGWGMSVMPEACE